MKNIVISDDYNSVDLKPSDLLKRYIEMTQQDVGTMLAASGKLKDCACPACGSQDKKAAFTKFSLSYQECSSCHTLYVSPRPDDKTLNEYYQKSAARTFWRDELSKATDKKRKEKIVKPRFQWILESTREHLPTAKTWIDVNTTQYSYVDGMADADIFNRKILLNPYLRVEQNQYRGIEVIQQPWWEQALVNSGDVMTLFEVVDHTSDVDGLFTAVKGMLKKGGLCFVTAILASGFDVQVLWDKADNLYPPDRLNCLTVEGFKALFAKHGFECLEFSTPGILDLEIIAQSYQKHPELSLPRFVRDLIQSKDEQTKRSFQEFLQSACMSSYGRILIRKKG
jgi:Zn ribbon nucleic-acid-binding protein